MKNKAPDECLEGDSANCIGFRLVEFECLCYHMLLSLASEDCLVFVRILLHRYRRDWSRLFRILRA
jgi:hypothetical protein